MAVVTHSAALCVGAAAVTLFLHRHSDGSTATKNNNVSAQKKTKQSIIPTSHSECFNHDMLPTLPIRISQPNDNLLIAFDTRNRNPAFVLERIKYEQHKDLAATEEAPPSRKNKRFYEDKTIPVHHRSRNHHYRNSGYDRGHLAPAADFKRDGELHDSFSLSNISPQLPRFNRTLWLRVEEFVRSVAEHEGKQHKGDEVETWVMTGPLWLPSSTVGKDKFQYSFEAIGHPPSLIHVPTHFFKVVVVISKTAESDSGSPPFQLKKFAAFVLPHLELDEKHSKLRLVDCIVRLTDLEAVAGLEFFPKLLGSHNSDGNDDGNDTPLYKELADALTDDVRAHAKNNQLLLLEDDNANHDENGTIQSRGGVGISKRRQKKIKQLLRDHSPFLFQHLCKNNNACFKYL